MSLRASLKAAAVGGIVMVWAKITMEAIRLSWDIILSPQEDAVVRQMAMCERCDCPFFKDEVDFALCAACGDALLEK